MYLGHGKLHGQKCLVGEVGLKEALVWKSLWEAAQATTGVMGGGLDKELLPAGYGL